MGPGKRATLSMQWVTCDDHKLTVSSGWSERGRIIDMMQFDGIRVIFSFSHVHEHFSSMRQAPITRVVRRDENGNSISVSARKKDKENRRKDSQPSRRAMRGFRLCDGKLRPRYYYFGIEFTEHRDNTSAPRRRQRRLIIFATDIKSDRQAWLDYFSSLGDLKYRSVSRTSNTHGCFSVRDELRCHSLPEPQTVGRLNLEERDWGSCRSYEPLEFAATGRPGDESSPYLVDFDELSESRASVFPPSRHNEQLRMYLIAQLTDEETRLRKTLLVEEDSDRRRLCAVRQALFLAFRDTNSLSAWTSTPLAMTGKTDDATLAACDSFFPQCEEVSPETSQCTDFITETIKMLQRIIAEKNNYINDMKKELDELRRQLTAENKEIQTLEETHRPNICNKDVYGKKGNKEATTPPNKPGGQETDDRVRNLIGTVQELKERLRATELARSVLEKQNERRRRELEEQLAQLGTERDALAERVSELDTQLGSANASLHDAELECELVAGLLGVPTVEAGCESGASVAGRLRYVSGAVRELGEQNERRRRELEEQLAQLGTERDALAERVSELDTQLGSANASLHDAELECELVAGLLGVPTVEAGCESGASVAGRLRCVSGAVRELGEQNERERLELAEAKSRHVLELEFACSCSLLFVDERNALRSECGRVYAELEELKRSFSKVSVSVNDAVEKLGCALHRVSSSSGGDVCVCKGVDVISSSSLVDPVAVGAVAVGLERLASVWHTVGQGQHVACARYYEVVCKLLRDIFKALGLVAPSFSFQASFGASEEVLQELLTWTSTSQDCANVDGNEGSFLARYEETVAAGLRVVETDVLQLVRLAADRILKVRLAHEAVGNALGDGTERVAAGTSGGEDEEMRETGVEVEDDSVVAKVRELHLCLTDSLESLVTSLRDDTEDAKRLLHDGASFAVTVKELTKECRGAAAAFVDIISMLQGGMEEREEVPGSDATATATATKNNNNNPKPPFCGYDDLVECVRRSLARARGEREKYKRLCEELRRVIATTTGTVSVAAQSSLIGVSLPHADDATDNISSFADALANQKKKLCLSKEDLVGLGDSDSSHSPLGSRHSFEIVHQVRSHIASKVAEVQELRTAVTTSVEKLGGTVSSPSVASHVIANTLLEVVRETSASIADVQALIDPDAAAARSGPPRLRDLVGCLEVKVKEWETSMREARELVNSVMNVNDPNYSLAASPGRSLTRKSKPKPVVAGRGDESLSLNRTFPVSSESSSVGQFPDGRSFSDASPRKNRVFTPFTSEAEGGGVSGKFVQDAVLDIRAKLIGIRQLTNACATAVCLMGGEDGVERQALDMLPVQLLRRAQEVNEVIQLTQDAVSLLDGTEKELGESAGGDAASSCPSIRTRMRRLVEGMKALKDENESLRLQGAASMKQKAFLLQDFEAMRDKFADQEKRLSEKYQKLLGECNELRGTIDRRMQEIQERDDALATQERRNAELEGERERLHVECDQLRRQLTTLRVTRDDLQALEAGPKEAAVMLRRASAFLYERLQNAINQISKGSSSSTSTSALWTVAEEKVTGKLLQEVKPEGVTKAPDANDASVSAAQLMTESGRELRRCGQVVQQIELHLRTVTQLRHWVRWVCVRTKEELISEEAAVRLLLREACRSGAVLLSEKMRVAKERDDTRYLLQQHLDEVLSKHEEERAEWKRRLQDLEEAQKMPLCSRFAASNVAAVREGACELQREGSKAHSRLEQWIIENTTTPLPNASMQQAVAAAAAAAAVVVEKTTELCGVPLEYTPAALEFLPAIGGNRATGVWRQEKPLVENVNYTQQLAEDLSRCRMLLQEQLLTMGENNDDDVLRSQERQDDGADQRASLSILMERHKSSLKRLFSERAELHFAWQAAQNEVLRLRRELQEGEERYTRDTEEAGRRIGDLRAIVQQKIAADAKTEQEMEEIQSVMDQHLAVLYSYAKEEEAVKSHLRELCLLMRSKTNVQKRHARLHF
ncbi:hypothetical protein MOQ_004033 [Trypanosoma cruzi marinkellei]|uniref:Kinesin n=1 Tax=Trypanosoma cruzi marinkellei TaxID=85056 RepID=K2NB92_TRYCR|nr:hypothetical protein MOQ_004033 [Trypanosoma cruzi marinkellei]